MIPIDDVTPPRSPSAPRAGALAGALGGALLCAAIALRAGAGGRADVATICNGEVRSGLPVRADLARVDAWIRAHVRSPGMGRAFSAIRDMPLAERGGRLRDLAHAVGLSRCPMADTLDAMAAEDDYRLELEALCSYATFPGLADLDDAARAAAIEAWLDERARTPRARFLAAPFAAATPRDRAALLGDVAREADLWTCDTAKVLAVPPVVSCAP